MEETKNKPPTESKYVGVNATALASVDQEKKKGLMESYRYNFKKTRLLEMTTVVTHRSGQTVSLRQPVG